MLYTVKSVYFICNILYDLHQKYNKTNKTGDSPVLENRNTIRRVQLTVKIKIHR